jgi:hypothetical protein
MFCTKSIGGNLINQIPWLHEAFKPSGKGEEGWCPQAHENTTPFTVGKVRLSGHEPDGNGRHYRKKTADEAHVAQDPPIG